MAESHPGVTAKYSSPSNEPFTISTPLPASPTTSAVTDKTNYLKALREAIGKAQDGINKELTTRMDEDKSRAAASSTAAAAAKVAAVDEDKEEENYGEEPQEED